MQKTLRWFKTKGWKTLADLSKVSIDYWPTTIRMKKEEGHQVVHVKGKTIKGRSDHH